MTEAIKADILAHLVFMAGIDKALAWASAKQHAKIGECLGWADLPDLLAARMQAKQEVAA